MACVRIHFTIDGHSFQGCRVKLYYGFLQRFYGGFSKTTLHFYNEVRPHRTLKYKTPKEYEVRIKLFYDKTVHITSFCWKKDFGF